MSDLTTELSKRSKYYIPKHRYLELYHYCLQYPEWKDIYQRLPYSNIKSTNFRLDNRLKSGYSDNTSDIAIIMDRYHTKMKYVEQAAYETDPELSQYIILGVTEGRSYNWLSTMKGIPCSKDTYYRRYRKFFWILDRVRE